MSVSREELYRLIDALPATELPAARRFLEYLRDVGNEEGDTTAGEAHGAGGEGEGDSVGGPQTWRTLTLSSYGTRWRSMCP